MTARERLGLERALGNLRLGIRWQRLREFSIRRDLPKPWCKRCRNLSRIKRVPSACDEHVVAELLESGNRTGLLQALVDTQSWLYAVLGKSSRLTKRYRRLTTVEVEHAHRR